MRHTAIAFASARASSAVSVMSANASRARAGSSSTVAARRLASSARRSRLLRATIGILRASFCRGDARLRLLRVFPYPLRSPLPRIFARASAVALARNGPRLRPHEFRLAPRPFLFRSATVRLTIAKLLRSRARSASDDTRSFAAADERRRRRRGFREARDYPREASPRRPRRPGLGRSARCHLERHSPRTSSTRRRRRRRRGRIGRRPRTETRFLAVPDDASSAARDVRRILGRRRGSGGRLGRILGRRLGRRILGRHPPDPPDPPTRPRVLVAFDSPPSTGTNRATPASIRARRGGSGRHLAVVAFWFIPRVRRAAIVGLGVGPVAPALVFGGGVPAGGRPAPRAEVRERRAPRKPRSPSPSRAAGDAIRATGGYTRSRFVRRVGRFEARGGFADSPPRHVSSSPRSSLSSWRATASRAGARRAPGPRAAASRFRREREAPRDVLDVLEGRAGGAEGCPHGRLPPAEEDEAPDAFAPPFRLDGRRCARGS